MAVYCTQCGTLLSANARFCSNCGFAVAAAPGGRVMPLLRPRTGRQIAGVCLALARSYGWDATAVRIIAVIALVFSSGLLGIAYVAAWVTIPEEPLETPGVYSRPV
jgi:phage shock protein PspC (stress-responsive transcriptional regulator)